MIEADNANIIENAILLNTSLASPSNNISNQNETYAAVTGDGLTAGDQLVVDGQNVVQANEKVNIVQ